MTPEEIISADYKANHAGREYTEKDAQAVFKKYLAAGEKHVVFGKTMFLMHMVGKDAVEFHSINGGGPVDIINGVNNLLQVLSAQFSKAVTYYDNPKINALAEQSKFPHKIRKVNKGIDRTYELSFDLRGA